MALFKLELATKTTCLVLAENKAAAERKAIDAAAKRMHCGFFTDDAHQIIRESEPMELRSDYRIACIKKMQK